MDETHLAAAIIICVIGVVVVGALLVFATEHQSSHLPSSISSAQSTVNCVASGSYQSGNSWEVNIEICTAPDGTQQICFMAQGGGDPGISCLNYKG